MLAAIWQACVFSLPVLRYYSTTRPALPALISPTNDRRRRPPSLPIPPMCCIPVRLIWCAEGHELGSPSATIRICSVLRYKLKEYVCTHRLGP